MPDTRKHRGPNPQDADLFHTDCWPVLQQATADLSWLLTRNYSMNAAVKLVGDRYSLRNRQRLAVQRSACSDQALASRQERQIEITQVAGEPIDIDGFNLLLTVEAALAGAVIILGRDGCFRDMASVHGTFRMVTETPAAIQLIGQRLAMHETASVKWLLDSPVSNSGRLATQLRRTASSHGWDWDVQLVTSPDFLLQKSESIVVSADSVVIDGCNRWCNLARDVIEQIDHRVYIVPMIGEPR